jgi:acyl carrier protein
MPDSDKISQVIYKALDEINQMLPQDQQIKKSPDTVLFGKAGKLDSLGIVNLIVTVEQEIEEAFGAIVMLSSEEVFSSEESPLATIGSLICYIADIMEENPD